MTNETDNTSLVIIDHDNDQQLEPMLRRSLEQADEATKREVIVVAGKGRKESEALLERLRPQYPDLRITFVPDSSRRMNRRKIALTLGVKAATHNQIVIFDTLTQHFTPYMQFAQSVMHKKLARRTGGIDFATGNEALTFSKNRFLERNHFEANLNFLSNCYEAPQGSMARRLIIRLKYLLAKCHLYRG